MVVVDLEHLMSVAGSSSCYRKHRRMEKAHCTLLARSFVVDSSLCQVMDGV